MLNSIKKHYSKNYVYYAYIFGIINILVAIFTSVRLVIVMNNHMNGEVYSQNWYKFTIGINICVTLYHIFSLVVFSRKEIIDDCVNLFAIDSVKKSSR